MRLCAALSLSLLISTIAPVYAQSTVFENVHQVCMQLDQRLSEQLTQMENFPDLAAVEVLSD
jgi:hypothetical protein